MLARHMTKRTAAICVYDGAMLQDVLGDGSNYEIKLRRQQGESAHTVSGNAHIGVTVKALMGIGDDSQIDIRHGGDLVDEKLTFTESEIHAGAVLSVTNVSYSLDWDQHSCFTPHCRGVVKNKDSHTLLLCGPVLEEGSHLVTVKLLHEPDQYTNCIVGIFPADYPSAIYDEYYKQEDEENLPGGSSDLDGGAWIQIGQVPDLIFAKHAGDNPYAVERNLPEHFPKEFEINVEFEPNSTTAKATFILPSDAGSVPHAMPLATSPCGMRFGAYLYGTSHGAEFKYHNG